MCVCACVRASVCVTCLYVRLSAVYVCACVCSCVWVSAFLMLSRLYVLMCVQFEGAYSVFEVPCVVKISFICDTQRCVV